MRSIDEIVKAYKEVYGSDAQEDDLYFSGSEEEEEEEEGEEEGGAEEEEYSDLASRPDSTSVRERCKYRLS